MSRLSMIFVTVVLLACNGREAGIVGTRSTGAAHYRWLPVNENRSTAVENIVPAHYNIELIDVDTLHPVMQVTYSVRCLVDGVYRWVDAVERLPITVEQYSRLQRLRADVYSAAHGIGD